MSEALTEFTRHEDPSHSWLAVPIALLRRLGIADKITGCSYQHKGVAYLEEDLDMPVFLEAYRLRYGSYPTCNTHYIDRTSIHDYDRYEYKPKRAPRVTASLFRHLFDE